MCSLHTGNTGVASGGVWISAIFLLNTLLRVSILILYLHYFLSYFREILEVHNLASDWFSFVFLIWNFGAVGLMVIHWKGPLRLQQAYLILISALVVSSPSHTIPYT